MIGQCSRYDCCDTQRSENKATKPIISREMSNDLPCYVSRVIFLVHSVCSNEFSDLDTCAGRGLQYDPINGRGKGKAISGQTLRVPGGRGSHIS